MGKYGEEGHTRSLRSGDFLLPAQRVVEIEDTNLIASKWLIALSPPLPRIQRFSPLQQPAQDDALSRAREKANLKWEANNNKAIVFLIPAFTEKRGL